MNEKVFSEAIIASENLGHTFGPRELSRDISGYIEPTEEPKPLILHDKSFQGRPLGKVERNGPIIATSVECTKCASTLYYFEKRAPIVIEGHTWSDGFAEHLEADPEIFLECTGIWNPVDICISTPGWKNKED